MDAHGGTATAVLERTPTWCRLAGYEVVLIPRADHCGAADPQVREALELERTVMTWLGDAPARVAADIAETLPWSSFALVYRQQHGDDHDRGPMVGAVRFMLGRPDGVKTLWDLPRDWPGRRVHCPHRWVRRPERLVDAISLAPSPASGLAPAQTADLLFAVCQCIGGALLRAGRAYYVTADLHHRFLAHVTRLGYRFHPLVPPDPERSAFIPAVASLAAIDHLAQRGGSGGPAAFLPRDYEQICADTDATDIEAW